MQKTNFEKLDIYRLSEELSDAIWKIVYSWKYLPLHTVGKQLITAADSIGANITGEPVAALLRFLVAGSLR